MSVKRPEALKRVPVPSIDDLVDEFMEFIPHAYVDLADESRRVQMKDWIRRVMNHAAQRIGDAHAEAATNAIREVDTLMRNPSFYVEKKRLRSAKNEKMAATRREREIEAARKLPVF